MEYVRCLLILVVFSSGIRAEECDVLIDGDEYESIISPNFPEDYENGMSCRHLIRAPPGQLVMISFNSFMIEMGPGCSYDSLKVYDGGSPSSALLNKFCGYDTPPSILSSSRQLLLVFETDAEVTDEGFNASISFVSASEVQKTVVDTIHGRYQERPSETSASHYIIDDTFHGHNHPDLLSEIPVPRPPRLISSSSSQHSSMNACGDGWITFRGSSYCFMETAMMWHEASSACSEIGGHLVTINSRSENNFIKRSTRHLSVITSWIGYNDREREGNWTWEDTKETSSFTNWQNTEPNNLNNEDCAIIYLQRKAGKVHGGWHDNPCCSEFTSICEKLEEN